MQPNEKRLFNWLKRAHPQLNAEFWKRKKSGQLSGLGLQVPTSGTSGGVLDQLKNLANEYYQFQIQKDTLEAQLEQAKLNQELLNLQNVPPITTGTSALITPQTAGIAIAALLGLWAFARR